VLSPVVITATSSGSSSPGWITCWGQLRGGYLRPGGVPGLGSSRSCSSSSVTGALAENFLDAARKIHRFVCLSGFRSARPLLDGEGHRQPPFSGIGIRRSTRWCWCLSLPRASTRSGWPPRTRPRDLGCRGEPLRASFFRRAQSDDGPAPLLPDEQVNPGHPPRGPGDQAGRLRRRRGDRPMRSRRAGASATFRARRGNPRRGDRPDRRLSTALPPARRNQGLIVTFGSPRLRPLALRREGGTGASKSRFGAALEPGVSIAPSSYRKLTRDLQLLSRPTS